MDEINKQLEDVLSGKLKADEAHKDVQTWFRLSVYNLADTVAKMPTKQARAQALAAIEGPFYDDVKELSKIIFTSLHN